MHAPRKQIKPQILVNTKKERKGIETNLIRGKIKTNQTKGWRR
jgi:hypothetical protein